MKTRTKVGYRWNLRMRMAERNMFATSDLVPLLAARGVMLSREQVYRLVARVPERLSLQTLAVLCDILDCEPGELIELTREAPPPKTKLTGTSSTLATLRPRRAQVASGPTR